MFLRISASVGNKQSCDRDQTTYLTGSNGYISSTALTSSNFGTAGCPFTITVLPGQTIDFSIYDFTLKDASGTASPSGTGPSCPVKGIFTENRVSNQITLCNGSLRQRHLYSSRTHRVVVYFTLATSIAEVPLFFLKYQGEKIIL